MHVLAKVFGWAQFLGQTGVQMFAQPIHGWGGWLSVILSFATAIGIHAAASTDGTK